MVNCVLKFHGRGLDKKGPEANLKNLRMTDSRGSIFAIFCILLSLFFLITPRAYSATKLTPIESAQPEVASEVETTSESEPVAGDAPLDQNQIISFDPSALGVSPVATPLKPGVKEETRERERSAGEDPLAQNLSAKEDVPERQTFRPDKLELYGSVRLRYLYSDMISEFSDGGSRIGLNGELQLTRNIWLLGRGELGFNLLGSVNELFNDSSALGDGHNLNKRLIYAAVETSSNVLIYGKNWSTYYQVAGMTDRFEAFGAEASGVFNAYTDGGLTGTGRADSVLQSRIAVDFLPGKIVKPFKLSLQVQPGQPIPFAESIKYSYSYGLSAILETKAEFNLGVAYNQAVIDKDDLPTLNSIGIDGDAKALVFGTRKFGDRGYLSTTLSFLENHETTSEGLYFDGWGWEFFGSYNLHKSWWVIGGWNNLEPYKDEVLVQDYRIRYAVLGLRYSFEAFTKMMYAEVRLDDSLASNGTPLGNVYSLGVRWDLP